MRFPYPQTIAFAGDWHGNTPYAIAAIHYAAGLGAEVIIQCGDFGYNFKDDFLQGLNHAAEERSVIVLFVDGNHENFDWLYDQPVDEVGVRPLRERVWHLPRGFRWIWGGVRFLALGGGQSVDQHNRVPHVSWWPQERITQSDLMRVGTEPTDVMVTHDAPIRAHVPLGKDKTWGFPDHLIEASQAHRWLMQMVVDEVKPRWLIHGHYHIDYEDTVGDTQVVGLSFDGDALEKNILVREVKGMGAGTQTG